MLFAFALFLLLSVLQSTVVPFISIKGIEPQLLVIFVVYYSLSLKDSHALWFGFLTGLLYDLLSGGVTGVSAFGLTLAAFITIENKSKFQQGEIFSYSFLYLIFIVSSIYALVTNFLNGFTVNVLYAIFVFGVLSGVYTTLFATPMLFLIPGKKLNE